MRTAQVAPFLPHSSHTISAATSAARCSSCQLCTASFFRCSVKTCERIAAPRQAIAKPAEHDSTSWAQLRRCGQKTQATAACTHLQRDVVCHDDLSAGSRASV